MKNRQVTVSKDALEDMRTRLAEAERQREVLADALRIAARVFDGARVPMMASALRDTLRGCGLLRPQDDPAMIPAAWLPGAEDTGVERACICRQMNPDGTPGACCLNPPGHSGPQRDWRDRCWETELKSLPPLNPNEE